MCLGVAVCFLSEMKGHCFDVSVVKVWSPAQVMNVLPVIVFIVWTGPWCQCGMMGINEIHFNSPQCIRGLPYVYT